MRYTKVSTVLSQSTISNTLKRSAEYLSDEKKNSNVKRHKSTKYPDFEKTLYEWFLQYQEKVNITGEMIQTKAKELLQKMYGEATTIEFNFSSGWLECFKARHEIKSYRRFSESGSVVMENIENALPEIRSKLDQFEWKDIYNMDETGLFYHLKPDHSLATKQLEGRKNDKERITVSICCNGDGSDRMPLWIIGKYAKPRCFKQVNIDVKATTIANCFRHCKIRSHEDMDSQPQVSEDEGINLLRQAISGLRYRNAIDVEDILNYPTENNAVMESASG